MHFSESLRGWRPLRIIRKSKKKFKYRIFVSSNESIYLVKNRFWLFLNRFKRFTGDRNILRSLAICFALSAFAQFTLNNTIKSYAVIILKKTGASIDPNVSSIILGGAFIVGALLTSYSADILGRKFLNIVSLLGSAMGLSLVALYYYLRISGLNLSAFDWVPVTSLSFVILISSAGIIPLLFVCSVEILPPKV